MTTWTAEDSRRFEEMKVRRREALKPLTSVIQTALVTDHTSASRIAARLVEAGPAIVTALQQLNPTAPVKPTVDEMREKATILAALRYWQGSEMRSVLGNTPFLSIATDDGTLDPLSSEEIDALCENINFTTTTAAPNPQAPEWWHSDPRTVQLKALLTRARVSLDELAVPITADDDGNWMIGDGTGYTETLNIAERVANDIRANGF